MSNIIYTKYQNLNDSRLISAVVFAQSIEARYIWVIHNFIAY